MRTASALHRRRVVNQLTTITLASRFLERRTELTPHQRDLVRATLQAATELAGELDRGDLLTPSGPNAPSRTTGPDRRASAGWPRRPAATPARGSLRSGRSPRSPEHERSAPG